MGKSGIYPVYGVTHKNLVVGCLTRLEMIQQSRYWSFRGDPIKEWFNQTPHGLEMIENFKKPYKGLITCPACKDTGYRCFICNYSGKTTLKHLKCYQDWQVQVAINHSQEEV